METVANCAQHGEITWSGAAVLIAIWVAVVAMVWALVYGAITAKMRSGGSDRGADNF